MGLLVGVGIGGGGGLPKASSDCGGRLPKKLDRRLGGDGRGDERVDVRSC